MPPQKQQKRGKKGKKNSRRNYKYAMMPEIFYVSLKHDVRTQNSGSTFNVYNFDACSLQTLQPMLRDQLLGIYTNYVVMGITVVNRIVNRSTTVDAEILTYHGLGSTVTALSFAQALEFKTTKRTLLSTSGNKKVITITQSLNFRNCLKARFWDDSDFWGTASAAPPISATANFYSYATGIYSANGSASVDCTMDRSIMFHVKFFNLAAVANSIDSPAPRLFPLEIFDTNDDDSTPENSPRPSKPKPTSVSDAGIQQKQTRKQK